MEHVLAELAPGRQRGIPPVAVPAAVQPDTGRAGRRGRRFLRPVVAGQRPVRHRQEVTRQRAEMREFESALARLVR